MNDAHTQSQDLASRAAVALRKGQKKKALDLYSAAADAEQQALAALRPEHIRTRGILAVSVASLLYKARRWEHAERALFTFLADAALLPAARRELRELLEVVWDEKLLAEELKSHYLPDSFLISLRGGAIGFGSAPLDQFLHVFEGLRALFYRVTEWVAKEPFRQRGLPSPEIRAALQTRVAQQLAGSYRFRVKLVEQDQLLLFEEPKFKPADVADTLFAFVEHASDGQERELNKLVPDRDYRVSMLKLLRNIAPDGTRMSELQLTREQADEPESVYISREVKRRITEGLREKLPAQERFATIRGTLRALDLDRSSIDILTDKGERLHCHTEELILDDVLGPMVNHAVLVTGRYRKLRGSDQFYFSDIELDDANPAA